MTCPTCGTSGYVGSCPPEPPIGTWVRDRHGAVSVRTKDSDGHVGWAPAPFGFYACGLWESMWQARGPLIECCEWGADVEGESSG